MLFQSATHIRSVGMLLRMGLNLYRREWRMFLAIVAWFIVPFVVVHSLTALLSFGVWNLVFVGPFGLLFLLLQFLTQLGLTIYLMRGRQQSFKTSNQVFRAALKLFLPGLTITILMTLCLLLMGVVLFLPINFLMSVVLVLPLWFKVLVNLLLFIPWVLVTIWLSFGLYVLVDKDQRGLAALRFSRSLVGPYALGILGRVLGATLILVFPLTLMVALVLIIIGALLGQPGLAFTDPTPWWVDVVTNSLSALIMPLFVIIHLGIYQDLQLTH